LLEFTKSLTQLWREHPVFQRRKFFQGRAIRGSDVKDIAFLNPGGGEMTDDDWNSDHVKCLGVRLAGDMIGEVDERGEPIIDDTPLILLNAHYEVVPFTLPETRADQIWERVVETYDDAPESVVMEGGSVYNLRDRSMTVLLTRDREELHPSISRTHVEALRREARQPTPLPSSQRHPSREV
jgi:glycogen operon protein